MLHISLHRFLPAVLFSFYVLASAFWIRPVSDTMRRIGVLRIVLVILATALLGFFLREGYRRHRDLSFRRLFPVLTAFAGYGWVLWPGHLKAWEEWIHFIHLGILAYLFHRALGRVWISAALAGLVGMGEEILQIWAPGRFFDWHDIRINALAALLSAGLLHWRGEER